MAHDPREVLTRPAPDPTRSARFGPAAHAVYEVYEPAIPQHGTGLVLVHGGFWRTGYDRTHLRPLAAALAGEGWTVALVEYRGTGEEGGGYPATLDDVRVALSRVRGDGDPALAAPLLVGHSAGGHLAVCLLHQPEGRDLPGAVSLAGCLDLGLVARLHLGDGAAQALLGGEPADTPDVLAALDPVALGPAPAPVVAVHGEQDDRVPIEVSRSWWEQVGRRGRDHVVPVPGCEHFGLIDPLHPAHATVLEALRRLAAPDTGQQDGGRV